MRFRNIMLRACALIALALVTIKLLNMLTWSPLLYAFTAITFAIAAGVMDDKLQRVLR